VPLFVVVHFAAQVLQKEAKIGLAQDCTGAANSRGAMDGHSIELGQV
jgi:hypothetical protein